MHTAQPPRRTGSSSLSHGLLAALVIALVGGSAACGGADQPADPDERFPEPTTTQVNDEIPYTEGSVDIQGPTPIQTLLDMPYPGSGEADLVWYGFAPGNAYPQGAKDATGKTCDTTFGNKVFEVADLPKTIRGVVTIHPQVYNKISMCGEDHRYYGSYVLQDKSGSIMVLKDSRIADFSYGDRVTVEVRGVVKQFGRLMVLAGEEKNIDTESQPVPYQTLDTSFDQHFDTSGLCSFSEGFDVPEGFGDTYRVRGKICEPPTDVNFNTMQLQPTDQPCSKDPDVAWSVTLGLELGKRNFDFERGQVITATGPVMGRVADFGACIWEFELLAGRIGQLKGGPTAQ